MSHQPSPIKHRLRAFVPNEPFDRLRAPAKQGKGFTLIELLVVVAIIALLASLLLPSLKRARRSAYAAVCASNIRQLGLAALSYRMDFNDWVPIHIGIGATGTPSWRSRLYAHLGGRSVELFDCPASKNRLSSTNDFQNMNIGSLGVIAEHHAYAFRIQGFANPYGIHKNNSNSPGDVAWPAQGGWLHPEQSLYLADSYITWYQNVQYPSVEAPFGSDHIHKPNTVGYLTGNPIGVRRFADRHHGTNVLMFDGALQRWKTQELDAQGIENTPDNIWDVF